MFTKNGVTYTFHHVGIPTNEPRPNERYSEEYQFYTSDDDCDLIRVQWHRFEPDGPMNDVIKTKPHLAFKVSDLDKAIADESVILGPYEPIPGYRVAVIRNGGISIELIQTELSDEAIWGKAKTDNALYNDDEAAKAELAKGLQKN